MAGMEKEETFLHDQPDLEMNVDSRHGDIAAGHGQIQKAREFYEKARQIAQQVQLKDLEAFYLATQAYPLAIFGYSKQEIDAANAPLALSPSFNVKSYLASVLALAGENRRSLELATQVARAYDTLIHARNVLQLALGKGLSVFCQSALASPVEATSCAPVRSRICLAFAVQSESSQCTDSKIPPSLIRPS
jgi:hypothetical protein